MPQTDNLAGPRGNPMPDLGELLERLPDGFTPGPDDWGVKVEVAADKRRKEIEAARDGTSAQEELA